MASPLVGVRAQPCPHCGSAEVYLRPDGASQCRDCKWTGPPQYDSKFLQAWSTVILPPSEALPAPEVPHMDPRLRTAGALLIGAAAVHVAACFLVLYTIVSIVRLEILLQYHFLDWTAILGIPVQTLGIILQSVFAIIAIAGAVVVLGGYDGGSPVFGTLGLVAILFSFFLFGGMMGVIGGLLFTGAAVLLRPSAETTMPLSTPA